MTIVELAGAIGLITVVGIITMILHLRATDPANDVQRVSDPQVIRAALAHYDQDHHRYPIVVEPITIGREAAQCVGQAGWSTTCPEGEVYLRPAPRAPSGSEYRYTSDPGGSTYTIGFTREDHVELLTVGAHEADARGVW